MRRCSRRAIYPTAPLQWFGPIFFICGRNLEQNRVDITSLSRAAFQLLNAQSSNLYRSVTSSDRGNSNKVQWRYIMHGLGTLQS